MNQTSQPGLQDLIDKILNLRISLKIILLLLFLFVVVAGSSALVIHQLGIFKNDAFAINNLGVIRGSIQRISLLATSEYNITPIEKQIDDTFLKLRINYLDFQHSIGHTSIENLNDKFNALQTEWLELKTIIKNRQFKANSHILTRETEHCWELANSLTFEVQQLSELKHDKYKQLILLISLVVSIIIFLIIFVVYKIIHNSLEIDVITDPMTKLYNRTYFNHILQRQINTNKRYKTAFTLILYDIDYFKQINDRHGHLTGDRVLKIFSDMLKKNARDVDYVFRLGGEEFATIAPDCKLEQAKAIAEKYQGLLNKLDFGINTHITISAGIGEYQQHETSDELISKTDKALYDAKTAGRNRVKLS